MFQRTAAATITFPTAGSTTTTATSTHTGPPWPAIAGITALLLAGLT